MSAPAQHEDWLDFVRALLAADVRFLVVGAHALAVHGVPRGTQNLDLMTGVSGVAAFEDAWAARVVRSLGPVPNVPCIGREHLLANKQASGRRKDLGDVDALNAPPIG